MSVSQTVVDFVTLAIQSGSWMPMDRLYLQNRLIALIGEDSLNVDEVTFSQKQQSSLDLLDKLMEKALENKVISDSQQEKEILEAQIMDLLTPPPSVVNMMFNQHYKKNPKNATDYFYQLSKENNYIKTRAIARNIVFPAQTEYGELEITINLSKPEKDPKQIMMERQVLQINYPKCQLCMDNEGYLGRINHPARTNHRIIHIDLNGENWGFQYSPYVYYNEHSIILSAEHRPMEISIETFRRLLRIIEIFPHYFVGSNADLPIVGGSILSHDHYQAGRHKFPMAKAEIEHEFSLSNFSGINAGIVKWPMSVIRLQSTNQDELVFAADEILRKWRSYSDESSSIIAYSEDGTPHHTVTPIARRKGELFELDIVLRDNNVSEEHPDGIFHPHQEVQHIKKENIGLIEVMGLAVLPPRLNDELKEVEKYVLGKQNHIADYHKSWADKMKKEFIFSELNSWHIIQNEVARIFVQVLTDAGVYKRTAEGRAAFKRFLDVL